MTADLINLRQARKRKARGDREAEAERNRALHGESKASKQKRQTELNKAVRSLEGHRRDPDRESKDG